MMKGTRSEDLLGCCVWVGQESRMVMLVAQFRRNEKKLEVGAMEERLWVSVFRTHRGNPSTSGCYLRLSAPSAPTTKRYNF